MASIVNWNNIDYNCLRDVVPAINAIYIARRSQLGRWFYEETSPAQQGKIVGNSQLVRFYKIPGVDINYNENSQRTNARSFTGELGVFINGWNIYDRDRLEQLFSCRDIVVLFQLKSTQWLLMGESEGCLVDFDWNISSDENRWEVTFSSIERQPIREVDGEFVRELIDNPFIPPVATLCSSSWVELCSLGWGELCALSW